MGTDTDTQFLMSSDSGSKVQVQQAFFFERESQCSKVFLHCGSKVQAQQAFFVKERFAMFKSLSSLCGLGWREGEAGEADEKAERHRDDVERRRCHDKDEPGKDSVL